jgi:ATP-dependent Clp protease adaptor protein ClpS
MTLPSLPSLPLPEVLPREETQTRPRRQPPCAVVLHNDDYNTFGFVIGVLCQVFGYGWWKSFRLAWKAHWSGRSIVWTGSLEVAEFKAEQIRSHGPDPKGRKGVQPLQVTVEPLPGD